MDTRLGLFCILMVASAAMANIETPAQPADLWLARVSKDATPADAALLKRAQATLLGNVTMADAWKPYRGVVPSTTLYKGVWNWDSAFHAVAISNWDPVLAREQIRILFARQLPDGALPDVIRANGDIGTYCTKPPVMAWAIAVVDHRSPDTGFLREFYPKLEKLGDFWLQQRGGAADGLFYYGSSDVGWDSGWDNSIRWDKGYRKTNGNDHRLWAPDLNCYMVTHYRALAYIARRIGLPQDASMWTDKAGALAARINKTLWDDKLGFYVDRDRLTGQDGPSISPAGFMPLFVHIAPPDRAARLEAMAADPHKFFPGMPTAAYDDPSFEPHGMWRGPAWLNTSYFALKGLRDYGCQNLAGTMRSTLLGWMEKDPKNIREYYDPKSGLGLGAAGFGWSSAFAIEFIVDWNNDNLTWFFPPVPAR